MNIIVSPYKKNNYYFRSDSTLIRSISDYYIPDYIEKISVVPIICFRIERPGKAVAERFAGRYICSFMFGLLLQAELKDKGADNKSFIENSADYSTIIPNGFLPIDKYREFFAKGHPFTIRINGISRFTLDSAPSLCNILSGFSNITKYCSVRTGDYFACELSPKIETKIGDHIIARSGIDINMDLNIK